MRCMMKEPKDLQKFDVFMDLSVEQLKPIADLAEVKKIAQG